MKPKIKKYLLGALLLSSINSSAMKIVVQKNEENNINEQVETIRNWLDRKQLGININCCLRPIIGCIMSYYQTTGLTQTGINNEIAALESRITYILDGSSGKNVFKALLKRHWYVHYLIEGSIENQLKNITCSTLDQFLNPDFSKDTHGINKIIYERTCAELISLMNPGKNIDDIWNVEKFNLHGNMHFTALPIAKIVPGTMRMSKNKKYLKISDPDNKDNLIIWDIDKMTQTDSIQPDNIQWSSNHTFIENTDYIIKKNCLAFTNITPGYTSIILFKRPTLESYLCQELLRANEDNPEQLAILKKSETLKALTGFPGKQIQEYVDECLKRKK